MLRGGGKLQFSNKMIVKMLRGEGRDREGVMLLLTSRHRMAEFKRHHLQSLILRKILYCGMYNSTQAKPLFSFFSP